MNDIIKQNIDVIRNAREKNIDLKIIDHNHKTSIIELRSDLDFSITNNYINILIFDEEMINLINSLDDINNKDLDFLLTVPNIVWNYENINFDMSRLKETFQLPHFQKNLHFMQQNINFTICQKNKIIYLCDILEYMETNDLGYLLKDSSLNVNGFSLFVKLYISLSEHKLNGNSSYENLMIASSLFVVKKIFLEMHSKTSLQLMKKSDINYLIGRSEYSTINDVIELLMQLEDKDFTVLNKLAAYCSHNVSISLLETLYYSQEKYYDWSSLLIKMSILDKKLTNIFDVVLYNIYSYSNLITLYELNKVIEIIDNHIVIETSIYDFMYPSSHVINMCINSNFDKTYIDFIKSVIHRKSFLNMLKDNLHLLIKLPKDNILFNRRFYKIVNLNTLNNSQLEILVKSNNERSKYYLSAYDKNNSKNLDLNKPLTFNEFYSLIKQSMNNIKLYYKLYDNNVKIDKRLLLIKQFPYIPDDFFSVFNYDENIIFEKIVRGLMKNTFKGYIDVLKKEYPNLNQLDELSILILLIEKDRSLPYFKEIKVPIDVFYLFNHFEEVIESKLSLYDFKKKMIFKDDKMVYLLNELELSPDIVDANIGSVMLFFEKDLHKVFYELMNNGIQKTLQKNNLKLLVKAELLNKLEDIKFADEDFDLEIGMEIDKTAKTEWKNNLSMNVLNYTITETYDFNDIIRLGEYPVQTCQHWNKGIYSKSLLSNFDTNKKLMVSKLNNKTNARALFRLTKGTGDELHYVNSSQVLAFKDVENTHENEKEKNEELILFLEKTYSTLDNSQLKLVKKQFIELAKDKARRIGAKLVVSKFYEDILNYKEPCTYNIFISYSKNGCQYLDSLNGEATEIYSGRYMPADVFIYD